MPKFEVISSQLVYSSTIVEAESQEQAEQLAYEGDHKWNFYDCADWQIEEVKELENA